MPYFSGGGIWTLLTAVSKGSPWQPNWKTSKSFQDGGSVEPVSWQEVRRAPKMERCMERCSRGEIERWRDAVRERWRDAVRERWRDAVGEMERCSEEEDRERW